MKNMTNLNLIDGKISIDKLNNWFMSLTTNQKLMVVLYLPFDSTVIDIENAFYLMYELEYNIDEIMGFHGDFGFWLNRDSGINKIHGYLIYTKLNLKYKNKKLNICSLVDKNDVFHFLSQDQMIDYFKVSKDFKWKTSQLIEKYNRLTENEKNILNESFNI